MRIPFVILFFLVGCAACSFCPRPSIISITEARSLALGTIVTVHGSVTSPSGVFESSLFDKGFGLQDETAGIYVSVKNDLGLKPSQEVIVRGVISQSYGFLILTPVNISDVRIHGKGSIVYANTVATGAIGETTEGRIINVVGLITQAPVSDLPYGFKFIVDDGSGEVQIFVNIQTGINLKSLKLGQRLSITGLGSQYKKDYEINPRFPSDIDAQIK